MNPKMIGNPLVAWRDETTLQVGWGSHAVRVESAPTGLPQWLGLVNGTRSEKALLGAAERSGIAQTDASALLEQLTVAGLLGAREPLRVAVRRSGLIEGPLCEALAAAGVQVDPTADIVVFPQGQVPSLLGAPEGARRLVPLWFEARAVHVGPVLDEGLGPCPGCIDRAWARMDEAWSALVAQATSVPAWHDPAQLSLAAGGIAHIADHPSTVGLEMIFDPARPGPMWRVWSVDPDCECQLPQVREQPHQGLHAGVRT